MGGAGQRRGPDRRHFLKGIVGTAGVALVSAAIYELVDMIAQLPERPAFAASEPWPPEQYVLQNTQVAFSTPQA